MATPAVVIPKIMEAIRHVSEGKTPSTALELTKVSWSQWHKWTRVEPMATMLAEAQQRGWDILGETLVNIDQEHAEPAMASVISGNIKWYLARMKPQKYGDRSVTEHHITADKEIIEALMRAKDRAQTIEHVVATALPHELRAERLLNRRQERQEVEDLLSDEEEEAQALAELY